MTLCTFTWTKIKSVSFCQVYSFPIFFWLLTVTILLNYAWDLFYNGHKKNTIVFDTTVNLVKVCSILFQFYHTFVTWKYFVLGQYKATLLKHFEFIDKVFSTNQFSREEYGSGMGVFAGQLWMYTVILPG